MKGDVVKSYVIKFDSNEREALIEEIKALKLKNDPYPKNWYLKYLLTLLECLE